MTERARDRVKGAGAARGMAIAGGCLLLGASLLTSACGGGQANVDEREQQLAEATRVAEEAARQLQEEADALRAAAAEAVRGADLATILASPHRSDENRARDTWRHPAETLAFFGLQPDMTVIEIAPGRGWYAEIITPFLAGRGTYIAALPDPEGPRARYRQGWIDATAAMPELYAGSQTVVFDPPGGDLGPEQSADLVLTFRNAHSWYRDGVADAAFAQLFQVLRPGGHLGVVQHRARPDADPDAALAAGYVPEAMLIATAEAAGFVLAARSEINANPADTTDHPDGVWSLPPTLRGGDADRELYEGIGESDRMTLLFRRPE